MAKEGDSIHLTLVFNDGSKKMLDVPVKKMNMQMGSTMHKHDGHEMHKPAPKKMEQKHNGHMH